MEQKTLLACRDVSLGYEGRAVWEHLNLEIRSGERIRLTGNNGSGKTTLVRLLTGELFPTAGEIRRTDFSYVCLDQEYSLVDTPQTVLELRPRDQDAAQAGPIRRRHVGHKLQRAERRRKDAALPVLPDDLEPCSRSIYSRRTDQ